MCSTAGYAILRYLYSVVMSTCEVLDICSYSFTINFVQMCVPVMYTFIQQTENTATVCITECRINLNM